MLMRVVYAIIHSVTIAVVVVIFDNDVDDDNEDDDDGNDNNNDNDIQSGCPSTGRTMYILLVYICLCVRVKTIFGR